MSKFISIEGKSVIITGAAGIIGSTLAKAFVEDGALVTAIDVDLATMEEVLAKAVGTYGQTSLQLVKTDITDPDDCKRLTERVTGRFGGVDVLINNAAIDAKFDKHEEVSFSSRFENYDLSKVRKSLEVNVTGTITITQAVVKAMLAQGKGGSVVNLASTYSLVAPNQSLYDFGRGTQSYKPVDYVASKSFIPNFTRYIATFYAEEGIRCNTVVPHAIDNGHDDAFKSNFKRFSPLGRMSRREELLGAFILLASDASSYMTGSTVVVDGGWTAW